MKKILFSLILSLTVTMSCFANSWENHWAKAVEYCSCQNYEAAESEFCLSIDFLENINDENHPHVWVDRARLYALQARYSEALLDLNKALASKNLKENDRIRGLVTRMVTCMNLEMEDQALADYHEFKRISPNFPKVEFTKERVIIRNMPDCKCYKTVVKSLLVNSGICEKESDIQMLDSGICIAKKKSCHCGCDKAKEMAAKTTNEDDSRYWCDKLNLSGMAWCSKVFKRWDCQTACFFAVDVIKDVCYWCCKGGNLYKKCIKPFEDIVSYMDISNCDPYWD